MATALQQLAQDLVEKDPGAAARRLEAMAEDDAVSALGLLGAKAKSLVFPNLSVAYAAALLRAAEPEDFQAVTRRLEPERAAAIFMHLPEDARTPFFTSARIFLMASRTVMSLWRERYCGAIRRPTLSAG